MPRKRKIIVGDVHGCIDELQELLKVTSFKKNHDELFFLGDLINKGPNSLGVCKLANALGAKCIKGNHEVRFLNYLNSEQTQTIESFEKLKDEFGEELPYWKQWLERLPLYIETDDFILVHGGFPPETPLEEVPQDILVTIRTWDGKGEDLNNPDNPPWFNFYKGDKLVVFGHWAKRGLTKKKNVIGLDSGCVYGKKLSALVLPGKKVIQVDAKQTYQEIGS